jgi:hypothetical protein
MTFDVKELMIDITKIGKVNFGCQPTIGGCQATIACGLATNFCDLTTINCQPTVACALPTYQCLCTYPTIAPCRVGTVLPCRLGTYTCFGSVLTCAGTPYCAGSNDPTILYQGIDQETVTALKAQLHSALKEVEGHENRLAEMERKNK